LVPTGPGVVEPELADRNNFGQLLLDQQVIIVTLGAFHRGVGPAIQLADGSLGSVVRKEPPSLKVAGNFAVEYGDFHVFAGAAAVALLLVNCFSLALGL